MIPLFRRLWAAVLYDEMAVRRWLRGALLAAAMAGAQIAASPAGEAAKWTSREWAVRILFAVLAGMAGMINLGHLNPKTPPHAEPPAP
jgi:hypothetical protein